MCLLSVVLDSNYPVRQNYADVDLRWDFDRTPSDVARYTLMQLASKEGDI